MPRAIALSRDVFRVTCNGTHSGVINLSETITLETLTARKAYEAKLARSSRKKLSNAERQRAYKERMREAGFVQVTGWVRADQQGDVAELMARLAADPDLEVGPVRSRVSGKLQRLR